MTQHTLRDGTLVTIAPPEIADAAAVLEYIEKVAAETPFLTFGPGEHGFTVDGQIAFFNAAWEQGHYLRKATVDGEIVAFQTLLRNARPRLTHVSEFGISVLQKMWRRGLGRLMLEEMIGWARGAGLRKVNLRVRADNSMARSLYRTLGWVEEGRTTRAMRIGDTFHDEILMGLELDP